MSSRLAMVVMAAMTLPGNGPEKMSDEVTRERLDLSGKWEGNISHQMGFSISASIEKGHLAEVNWLGGGPMVVASYRLSVTSEGPGRFRLTLNGERYVGIYKWGSSEVILCYRQAEQGHPTSFRAGNGQHLLILRRAKPAK
jgi:hypothetical protein